ncbi:hypothetical protein J5Y03_06150 [Bacillus sp. RG28]|uniref:Uncharacterized protein n=1 Tax=Gottfriedia endophytica TaxID=2820819 RepID=A0A940NNG2_9BACI|nr:hypothetical protein [Gottfriedia endophytica]MBP0724770.1 hypothetical protein [Gottfriedia endophytica]
MERTRLAPTDIGANTTRKCAVSLPCGICEMAEELVCGTRQELEQQPKEVRFFTSFACCETTEEMVAGARQARNVERTWLAPTFIGANNNRSAGFTSIVVCEMAEELVCGTGHIEKWIQKKGLPSAFPFL